MAASIPPHVTLVYDDEAPDAALLLDRLCEVCATIPPVALQLGSVQAFEAPDAGLYVATEAGPSFALLRAQVLTPPFAPRRAVRPHVTLLHPRSIAGAPADWRTQVGTSIAQTTIIREVTLLRSDGGTWRVQAEIPLAGRN